MNASLDIDGLRAFVRVSELYGFTRAAKDLGATQAAVSLRIQRLERLLGSQLLDRTPRSVRLTPAGAAFVEQARQVLAAHDSAMASALRPIETRVRLGVSDHVLGRQLPEILAKVHRRFPAAKLLVRIGPSASMAELLEAGELSIALIRTAKPPRTASEGVLVRPDPLCWYGHPTLPPRSRTAAVPLVSLTPPCVVRATAISALRRAKIRHEDAFIGGGVAAVIAAAEAGLGVAALGESCGVGRLVKLGPGHGLPALPAGYIVLRSRVAHPGEAQVVRALLEVAGG